MLEVWQSERTLSGKQPVQSLAFQSHFLSREMLRCLRTARSDPISHVQKRGSYSKGHVYHVQLLRKELRRRPYFGQ